ncbi:RNA-directed DNA polymerase, eukaryota, Reverse transcriptase zinc-binding domain protein [Artemisia annua]|uniref:RNA-directed DNA polymerase, eukaryota, Reverse transcriptase zinc-binding domain protein n=1 Tax=Artemisia annua TaxID=35608 RepID=A0A2U1MFL7_ARTAN|nr:RNA-directed DNA polymerase, eukaryota, Reverse transcriptase zinc-binding domain protein [Artemisia annua]
MLAKWWWRFHNEGNALWCKLILSIHGQSGDSNTILTLKSKSGTWYHIVSIKNDLLNLGIDMSLIFKKKIGNGNHTRFWMDNWCVVSDRAPTFHQHYATTSAPIATDSSQIGPSASHVGLVYNWSWLRPIRSGPDLAELEDLCSLVFSNSCQVGMGKGNDNDHTERQGCCEEFSCDGVILLKASCWFIVSWKYGSVIPEIRLHPPQGLGLGIGCYP